MDYGKTTSIDLRVQVAVALDAVPWSGVVGADRHRAVRRGSAWSGCHGGQADDRIIPHRRDGFHCQGSGTLDGPHVLRFRQLGADQADAGLVVWKDADDIGAALDLTVQALDRVRRAQLRPVSLREGMQASTSCSASSISVASFGTLDRIWSATARHRKLAASAVSGSRSSGGSSLPLPWE